MAAAAAADAAAGLSKELKCAPPAAAAGRRRLAGMQDRGILRNKARIMTGGIGPIMQGVTVAQMQAEANVNTAFSPELHTTFSPATFPP